MESGGIALSTGLGLWLLSKIVVPIADRIWDGAAKQAPTQVQNLKQFVRRKTLELTTSDDELLVLGLFQGRQWNYASLLEKCEGQLDSEALLPIVTSLQAKGLLNEPRLEQPPNPRAMFTATSDALLVLPPSSKKTRRKARNRDVGEAVMRRARHAADLAEQQAYDQRSRRASYTPQDALDAAAARATRISEDRAWLSERGF